MLLFLGIITWPLIHWNYFGNDLISMLHILFSSKSTLPTQSFIVDETTSGVVDGLHAIPNHGNVIVQQRMLLNQFLHVQQMAAVVVRHETNLQIFHRGRHLQHLQEGLVHFQGHVQTLATSAQQFQQIIPQAQHIVFPIK